MRRLGEVGMAPFRFHDLRHTHVAWLVAGGVPLPPIQARLGHESITTTIDTYGHLLPVGDELMSTVVDTALAGGEIRPAPVMHLVAGGLASPTQEPGPFAAAGLNPPRQTGGGKSRVVDLTALPAPVEVTVYRAWSAASSGVVAWTVI